MRILRMITKKKTMNKRYTFNKIALATVVIGNIPNIIQWLPDILDSLYWTILIHLLIWVVLPILIYLFLDDILHWFRKHKDNKKTQTVASVLIIIVFLSKKPKNTPWVYSGDELGGLEKPKCMNKNCLV